MLKINAHAMNLDLTVRGFIAFGKIACHKHARTLDQMGQVADRLYGKEARGQFCDICGAPLYAEESNVETVEVAAAG